MTKQGFKVSGVWTIEHYDKKKRLINKFVIPNTVVNEGLNKILDVMFHGVSAIGTWYAGLISNSSYSAIAASDTMASHSGWTEFTGYSESVRQTWVEGAASSQSISNSSAMVFSINATGTVKGLFLCSDSTKSGTTGVLWAATLFASDYPVNNGDTLNITYTVSAS